MAEVFYFKIALHYKIIDKPNSRSSHQVPTIRGGGIIFLVGVVLFYFWNDNKYPYLLIGLLVSGAVSFLDDIRSLPSWVRFTAQIISVVLIFRECEILSFIPVFYLLVIGIVAIAIVNAFNFMDGINGMTGLYSLSILIPLYISEQNEGLRSLQLFTIFGLLVFNFFNTRKKAVCFAGDVGSITIAMLVIFLMIQRIHQTGNFIYAGMLLLYGIDSMYTILQRAIQKENIFKAHRKHLYQYLSNEKKLPQLWVSIAFAGIQVIINFFIINNNLNLVGLLILFSFLTVAYWIMKAPFLAVKKA
ncbi:MAG: glycosyltransferase family 4 protein [Ginsengibacter sp.]